MRLLGNILLLAFGMINLALGILTLVEGLMDNGLEGLYLPYGKLRYAIFLFLGTWCSAGAAVNLLRLELANYLDDEEYRELQKYLLADPIAGELVPRSGGRPEVTLEKAWYRKARWHSGDLLRAVSAQRVLDAYAVGQSEAGKRTGAYPEGTQGDFPCLRKN